MLLTTQSINNSIAIFISVENKGTHWTREGQTEEKLQGDGYAKRVVNDEFGGVEIWKRARRYMRLGLGEVAY